LACVTNKRRLTSVRQLHVPETSSNFQSARTSLGSTDSHQSLATRGISVGIPSSRLTLHFTT